jgi:hypothetical protein
MMKIAVDFDNTLFRTNSKIWPNVAEALPALDAIKKRQEAGDIILLHTCRTGPTLDAALQKCQDNGLIFDEVYGGKPQADVYIDDRALDDTTFNAYMRLEAFEVCVEQYNREIEE